MPNWCWNTLVVQGPDSGEVEAFIERNKGPEGILSFDSLVPMPPWVNLSEKAEDVSMVEDTDWYGWRLKKWGCKWDLTDDDDLELHGGPYQQTYTFRTAWNPPLAWLSAVAPMFPTLKFVLHYSGEDQNDPNATGSLTLGAGS